MTNRLALFVQRPSFDGRTTADDDDLQIIECVTCDWHVSYLDILWASNEMPGPQRSAFLSVAIHGRSAHHGLARIIRGWRA